MSSVVEPGVAPVTAEQLLATPDDGMRREVVRVEGTVFEWLDSGVRIVIVVNQKTRTATVYRSRAEITLLTEDDVLDGSDVVPGWTSPVREVFAA